MSEIIAIPRNRYSKNRPYITAWKPFDIIVIPGTKIKLNIKNNQVRINNQI